MMNIALFLLISMTLGICIYKRGIFSFMTAGSVGAALYSIPGVIGYKTDFDYSGKVKYFQEVDNWSILVLFLAWITIFLFCFFSSPPKIKPPLLNNLNYLCYKQIANIALVFSSLGIVYLIARDGPLFFLAERYDQASDFVTLIWRWIVMLGFGAAICAKGKFRIAVFLAFLFLIFVRGDRTIIAISLTYYLILADRQGLLLKVGKASFARLSAIFAAGLSVVIFGKPIYLSIKAMDFSILLESVRGENLDNFVVSAEPFVTFNHIPTVLDYNIHIPFIQFVGSILGQILLVPSAFGVNANLYYETVSLSLPYDPGYGIAGNFWAHALTVGSYPMVIVFALLFCCALTACDRFLVSGEGRFRLPVGILGALVAVYAHRNGLDNLLSFVRQILLASACIYALAPLSRVHLVQRPIWNKRGNDQVRHGRRTR